MPATSRTDAEQCKRVLLLNTIRESYSIKPSVWLLCFFDCYKREYKSDVVLLLSIYFNMKMEIKCRSLHHFFNRFQFSSEFGDNNTNCYFACLLYLEKYFPKFNFIKCSMLRFFFSSDFYKHAKMVFESKTS